MLQGPPCGQGLLRKKVGRHQRWAAPSAPQGWLWGSFLGPSSVCGLSWADRAGGCGCCGVRVGGPCGVEALGETASAFRTAGRSGRTRAEARGPHRVGVGAQD